MIILGGAGTPRDSQFLSRTTDFLINYFDFGIEMVTFASRDDLGTGNDNE